ncbi:MAG: sulfotransferase [Solirubrobacterales bacterium]
MPAVASPAPFIVGAARSGTTLLRMMLDAHSQLAIPPETNFQNALRAFERAGAAAATETIVSGALWGDYNLPAEEFSRRVQARRPQSFGDVMRTFFEFYAERHDKRRWGNKTPYYVMRMTLIEELLPEARFIHVVRDGRDVALSTVPVWFGAGDIAGVAEEWVQTLTSARRQAEHLSFYTEVRYEELVRDPISALKRICEFLELEWEPTMLDYHRDSAGRLAAELGDVREMGRIVSREERLHIHRLIGRPPQADRAERWRREMSAAEVRAFEEIAADTLQAFSYELASARAVRS